MRTALLASLAFTLSFPALGQLEPAALGANHAAQAAADVIRHFAGVSPWTSATSTLSRCLRLWEGVGLDISKYGTNQTLPKRSTNMWKMR
jgi:hypothetical protein